MSYGAQVKFGIARQTAGGTPVTVATSFHGFAFVSEDVGLEKEELISQNLIGRFEEGAVYDGISRVLGTIEFEMTPRNMLASLAASVNWSPGSVTSGDLRTHTWLPNTVDYDGTYVKAPWTVYKQFTDAQSAEQFYDAQFGQLELTVGAGAFVRGRITMNGGARSANGVGSANIIPLASDVGQVFPWNVASMTWGGTALSEASEVTVSLNENVDALYTTNASLAPYKFTRTGFREVSVAGTFYMVNRNILNDFAAGTQRQLLITLQNTRTAIQSGYFNYMKIDVPQLKITAFKPSATGPGEVSVSFTGRGVVDGTSNYALQFITITTYQAGF